MTSSPPLTTDPRPSFTGSHAAALASAINGARSRSSDHQHATLARYPDGGGRAREVVVRPSFEGSALVVDQDAATHGDQRLVAHLWPDEPFENAALVCASYVEQVRHRGPRCRPLVRSDLCRPPTPDRGEEGLAVDGSALERGLVDRLGRSYRLQALHTGMSIPELRWRRHSPQAREQPLTVSVREAVAALESYEPVLGTTSRELARAVRTVSTAVLRAELTRVRLSPIVLNRGLREATLKLIEREHLSLSEIATRCGRVKRDASGNASGETSWLARRLGLMPEGGKGAPTPWIHSDVLALIARRGLGLSPREVELD